MAFEAPIFKVPGTLIASEDLSDKQYHFVKLHDDGEVEDCDSASDLPLGVLQNAPEQGEQAEVMALGVSKVVAGGSLDAGETIGTSSSAKATEIDSTSDSSTGYIVGVMLKDVGGDEHVGTAMINCMAPTSSKDIST